MNDKPDSRIVTFDLMSQDPDYYFVLTEALREFAARQRAEAEDEADPGSRIRWAETAESAVERIEEALSTPATTGDVAASPEQMLREFHASRAIHGGLMPEQPAADIPGWIQRLRVDLLDEEVEELREAITEGDIVKIADAIGDIAYVAVGTAVTYGIPFDDIFAEVHRSNMTKVNTPDEAKLVKGPDYQPPDIAGVLMDHTAPPATIEDIVADSINQQSTWDNALRHPVFGCGDPGPCVNGPSPHPWHSSCQRDVD